MDPSEKELVQEIIKSFDRCITILNDVTKDLEHRVDRLEEDVRKLTTRAALEDLEETEHGS